MMLHARRAAAVVGVLALFGTTGCASFIRSTARSYDLAPSGLSRADDAFRRALSAGSYGAAFSRSRTPKDGAPDDALLRALYRGITGYYAGEYAEAVTAFAVADRLTEERLTKSLSRAAISVVTSDRVLPYLPTRTERLFLRYYAMSAFAGEGDISGAVVEARRLAQLLEAAAPSVAQGERALHATMRDAAGAVFEAAGERNDALVSYRNAALLRGVSRRDVDSIVLAEPGPDSATLIVFVESGFVAHRVDQGMTISLHDETRDSTGAPDRSVGDTSASANSGAGSDVASRTASLTQRALAALQSMPTDALFVDEGNGAAGLRASRERRVNRPMHIGDDSDSFVRVAWTALARSALPAGGMTIDLAGESQPAFARAVGDGADVSSALAEDFRRELPGMLTRAIARAVAKGAATEALREKHGDWAGRLASMVGSAVERADTRSWALLPGSLAMIRLTLPAGVHEASIRVGSGLEALTVRVPRATLASGEVRVVSTRVWRDASSFAPSVATGVDTPLLDARTHR